MATGVDDVFSTDTSQHWEMKRKASFSKLTGAVPRTIPGMYNVVEDPHADDKKEKLWKLMETYLPSDVHSIQRSIVNHVVSCRNSHTHAQRWGVHTPEVVSRSFRVSKALKPTVFDN